jgi:hypothetical protein
VLLDFGAPRQLPSPAGPEHGRTIPLPDIGGRDFHLMTSSAVASSESGTMRSSVFSDP